jgi:hypothetical protein
MKPPIPAHKTQHPGTTAGTLAFNPTNPQSSSSIYKATNSRATPKPTHLTNGSMIPATHHSITPTTESSNRLKFPTVTSNIKSPDVSAHQTLILHPATGQLATITTHPISIPAKAGIGVQAPNKSTISNIPNGNPTLEFTQTGNGDTYAPTRTQSNQQQQGNQHLTQQIIPQFLCNTPKSNDTWGASMDVPDESSIRLFFQNINGLQFSSQSNRWQPHLNMMKVRGVAIPGFAETNTNWNYQNVGSRITSQARQIFPNSVTTLSPHDFHPSVPSAYQPGGCLQISTSHWYGRIIELLWTKSLWVSGQVIRID